MLASQPSTASEDEVADTSSPCAMPPALCQLATSASLMRSSGRSASEIWNSLFSQGSRAVRNHSTATGTLPATTCIWRPSRGTSTSKSNSSTRPDTRNTTHTPSLSVEVCCVVQCFFV